jgi:hypothetical protein
MVYDLINYRYREDVLLETCKSAITNQGSSEIGRVNQDKLMKLVEQRILDRGD